MSLLNHKSKIHENQILCKFYLNGHCKRGKNCRYLHSESEREKWLNQKKECRYYNLGYCKEGSLCKYIHNHQEDLDLNLDEIDENNFIEIPMGYIQHFYGKSKKEIFDEFEEENLPNLIGIICHYSYPINKVYKILKLIDSNQYKIKYFLIRETHEQILESKEKNFVILGGDLLKIKKDESICIIVFILDEENENIVGFAKLNNKIENDLYAYKIDWLWHKEINRDKIKYCINRKDPNFIKLINCPDGAEIDNKSSKDLIKRMLNKKYNKEKKEEKNHTNLSLTQINNIHLNISNNTVNNFSHLINLYKNDDVKDEYK
jgi:hypothetical protein